jgi:serine/threonine-protein kinase
MSPEQLRSARDVDLRTDLWSLGVILHELLSNRLPFDGETVPELCAAILTAPAAPVRRHAAHVPEALERVIAKCLKKDPTDRYASAVELAGALEPFASDAMQGVARRMARITPPGSRASLAGATGKYETRAPRASPGEAACTEVAQEPPHAESKEEEAVHDIAIDSAFVAKNRWPWAAGALVALAGLLVAVAWPTTPVALEAEARGVPTPQIRTVTSTPSATVALPVVPVPSVSSAPSARPSGRLLKPARPSPPSVVPTTSESDYGGRK